MTHHAREGGTRPNVGGNLEGGVSDKGNLGRGVGGQEQSGRDCRAVLRGDGNEREIQLDCKKKLHLGCARKAHEAPSFIRVGGKKLMEGK